MKTLDFFYISCSIIKPFIVGFLVCYALPTLATPPSPETFNRTEALVLTLSDKWLEPDTHNNSFHKANRANSTLIGEKSNSTTTNLGCNMDITPLASSDGSFGNRVVGKCNINYHY